MSANVIFKRENEALFWEQWHAFIIGKGLGPRYLEMNIKYLLMFLEDLYIDGSFVYVENDKPAACVFLPIEKRDGEVSVSFRGEYVDAPLANKKVEKKVFSLIDTLARENHVSKIKFAIDTLSGDDHNYLMKYGYLDASILTYIIDLKLDLLEACRADHRHHIKKILKDKNFQTFIVDQDNLAKKLHGEYVALHHKCSGRITRPLATFDMQFEKIKAGKAFLVGLAYQGKNIAFVYFEYHNGKAIYASAADDPDYCKLPLYHTLVFKGMEYLKERETYAVDTGQPSCPSAQLDYFMDSKQANIALFKRGFGGHFKENFRGIKYFSKEAFNKDMSDFLKKREMYVSAEK